jgi:hypothetical protein
MPGEKPKFSGASGWTSPGKVTMISFKGAGFQPMAKAQAKAAASFFADG